MASGQRLVHRLKTQIELTFSLDISMLEGSKALEPRLLALESASESASGSASKVEWGFGARLALKVAW